MANRLTRTAVQIAEPVLRRIDRLAKRMGVSRSKVLRDATDIGLPILEQRQQMIDRATEPLGEAS